LGDPVEQAVAEFAFQALDWALAHRCFGGDAARAPALRMCSEK
jgi:hypothetical protein